MYSHSVSFNTILLFMLMLYLKYQLGKISSYLIYCKLYLLMQFNFIKTYTLKSGY